MIICKGFTLSMVDFSVNCMISERVDRQAHGILMVCSIRKSYILIGDHLPPFLHSQESPQPTLPPLITQEPILSNLRTAKYTKMSHPHANDNGITSFHTTNIVNDYTAADEKSRILSWLSSLEPKRRHEDLQNRRIDEVADWLLQTEEYQNWFAGIRGCELEGSALFCHGSPGVGKTYIR